MSEIKSQILAEVEESLGSHAVMVIADAMEKCPTLKDSVEWYSINNNYRNRGGRITAGVGYPINEIEISHQEVGAFRYPDMPDRCIYDRDVPDGLELIATVDTSGDGVVINFESPKDIPRGAPVVIREATTKQLTPVQNFTRDWIHKNIKGDE